MSNHIHILQYLVAIAYCDGISLCNNSIMVDGIFPFDNSIIDDEIPTALC